MILVLTSLFTFYQNAELVKQKMCQKVYEIVHCGLPWVKNLAKGEGREKIINLFNFFACKLLHPPFTYP